MGILTGFDIQLFVDEFAPADWVRTMQRGGWTWNSNGLIGFCPLGDTDSCDWTSLPVEQEDRIWELIDQKKRREEVFAVNMYWRRTRCGGIFTYGPDKMIGFCPDGSRLRLRGMKRVTNVNWYLKRLLPPFKKTGIPIEYIKWYDDGGI